VVAATAVAADDADTGCGAVSGVAPAVPHEGRGKPRGAMGRGGGRRARSTEGGDVSCKKRSQEESRLDTPVDAHHTGTDNEGGVGSDRQGGVAEHQGAEVEGEGNCRRGWAEQRKRH
jgi:hypothetical protein